MGDVFVFGYVTRGASDSTRERMAQFCNVVAPLASCELAIADASSYAEVAKLLHSRQIDLAWLPPIPYLALDRAKGVAPMVVHRRAGATQFHAALIARSSSPIRGALDLQGKRVAWVDPHSAAGYVVPRIELAADGVDPRRTFARERFYGSHEAVVSAVMRGDADVGATYAGLDGAGRVKRGAWMDEPDAESEIRVVRTFSAIAPDLFAARADMDARVRERLTVALVNASREKSNHLLMRDLFGADELLRWTSVGYDDLRRAVMEATDAGLLDGEERG
jgi:phosphate/phosphite/phosphonate ABC transporter binding protein